MKKSKTLTRRQQIDKMKVRWYNQMRNLLMRQFKELSKIYELDGAEELTKKKKVIESTNESSEIH